MKTNKKQFKIKNNLGSKKEKALALIYARANASHADSVDILIQDMFSTIKNNKTIEYLFQGDDIEQARNKASQHLSDVLNVPMMKSPQNKLYLVGALQSLVLSNEILQKTEENIIELTKKAYSNQISFKTYENKIKELEQVIEQYKQVQDTASQMIEIFWESSLHKKEVFCMIHSDVWNEVEADRIYLEMEAIGNTTSYDSFEALE